MLLFQYGGCFRGGEGLGLVRLKSRALIVSFRHDAIEVFKTPTFLANDY